MLVNTYAGPTWAFQDPLERILEEALPTEEPEIAQQLEEDRWKWASLLQVRFKRTGGSKAPTHLGGPSAWLWRSSVRTGPWQLSLLLSKDALEPWGSGRVPWRGPELKRGNLHHSGRRFQWIVGGFSIRHAFGLASGNRVALLPTAGSVVAIPSQLVRASPYAGTTGRLVRSGLLAVIRSDRAGAWFWRANAEGTASLSRAESEPAELQITDVSHTAAFTSRSSLARRHLLEMGGSGVAFYTRGRTIKVSILVEHLSSGNTSTHAPDLHASVPRSTLIGSMAAGLQLGHLRLVTESAAFGRPNPDWRIALRWRSVNGSALLLDHSQLNPGPRSPFGHTGKFFTSFQSESVQRIGIVLLPAQRHRLLGRWAQRARSIEGQATTTRQMALDWLRTVSEGWGMTSHSSVLSLIGFSFHQRVNTEGKYDISTRFLARRWFRPGRLLSSDIQAQMGWRNNRTKTGLTFLFAPSLLRRFQTLSGSQPGDYKGLSYAATLVIRYSRGARTTLYASYPAVSGSFPVLSGSSHLFSLGQRVRHVGRSGMIAETVLRLDRRDSLSKPRRRVVISVQVRIPIDGGIR